MQKNRQAFFILLLAPVLWGLTFPIMKIFVVSYSPLLFVLWRFWLAAIFMLPLIPFYASRNNWQGYDFYSGIIIGIINSGAFVLQAIALLYIGSSRTAFLAGMNVVLVPLLMPLFKLAKPRRVELFAASVCLGGIYLMGGDPELTHMSKGDLLVIVSALCVAASIIVTEKVSRQSSNFFSLTFYQLLTTGFVPVLFLNKTTNYFPHSWAFWGGVLYCSILATIIPTWLQLKYQKYVGSATVAIIFSLEAVTATFFAWLWGKKISIHTLSGGCLILASCIIPELYKKLTIR